MSDLERAARKHEYCFGGVPLPSVTRITGLIDNGKAAAMAGAAAKITREGGNYRSEWKEKAERGTRIHGYIEMWLAGEDAAPEPGDEGFLDAAEKYLIDQPQEWHRVEPIVVGDGYGGRLDAMTLTAVRDWKSGAQYDEHIIQLAAYVNGLGLALYDPSGNFVGYEPMPDIKSAGCVYLREDGTYLPTEYSREELDEAFNVFCGLLDVYNWLKGRK